MNARMARVRLPIAQMLLLLTTPLRQKRQPNSALHPTATIAARSVLRPPRLLRMAAAERNVRRAPSARPSANTAAR